MLLILCLVPEKFEGNYEGKMIGAKICASIAYIYIILFMQYKKLKSSNLTQIDVKTLIMDLTTILSLILDLRDEKKVISAEVIINQGSRRG